MNKQSNIHTNEIYIPLSINAGGIITPTLHMIGDNSRYQLELIPQIYNLCIKDNFDCVFQLMLTIIKSCWDISWDEAVLSKGKVSNSRTQHSAFIEAQTNDHLLLSSTLPVSF